MLCYPMFSNLLLNAFEASPAEATVAIDLVEPSDTEMSISITNQRAIPEAICDSFFDKYVTKGKSGGRFRHLFRQTLRRDPGRDNRNGVSGGRTDKDYCPSTGGNDGEVVRSCAIHCAVSRPLCQHFPAIFTGCNNRFPAA